jgi:hypothetical protein
MMRKQYQEGGIIDWFMSLFSDDEPKAAAAKAPRLPGKYKISDLRKMSGTTGKAIDPRTELLSGEYDGERMENIVKASKRYGIDPYTALAIDLQETGLGKRSPGSIGHTMMDFRQMIPTKMPSEEESDEYDMYARAIATKMQYADKLGIKDPLVRLQAYNGLGKIFPETEQNYHGFKMKKIYGVPVPKGGIDMRKNPLYGKRVSDIRDNILRKDKNLDAYIRSVKQKGGAVISPYGQWKYSGKDTIVPTSTGRITMKGVPYPVYGQDETGYGQMMYPDGEYRFPGNMVYEKPMVKRTGDSTLENIAEVFDPTGITSWDDVYRSYKETGWSPDTALEIFGALPMLGKVGKAGKWLGEAGKAVAVTARQKNNVKTFSKALQSVPYIGRATDAYQTIQQAPDAPITPFGNGGQHGGLDRWFAEKWVDVKTGKDCGRQEGEKRSSYPACRPSKRVSEDTPKTASELSSSEREKFKRSKTSSERINYQHRRKEYGGEQTETDMANKPNNPALWSRAKSLAKQKFDVYPSAYANGWAAKWYKGKGGTWSKAEYGMEVPMMAEGGKPEWLMEAQLKAQGYSGDALQQKLSSMAEGGTNNPGFKALPEFVQAKILSNMGYGGYFNPMMADGGEPNGEMALGQMAAVQDKMNKLLKFVRPDDNLDPWIASKLAVMDHSADAIADYMMYGPDAQDMEEQEMKGGGYVVTRSNDRKGKTHKVTGPDGTVKYFGDSKLGQHPKDPERKAAFYARHKKNLEGNPHFRAFARATWQDGGQIDEMANGGYIGYDGKRHMSSTPTWSGNMGYQDGGEALWHANWNDAEESYESLDPIMEQFSQGAAAMPARSIPMNVPVSAPVAKAAAAPRSKGSSYSVVDYMNNLGMASDYATRKALAEEFDIKGYRGTADQNKMLISAISQAAKSQGSKAAASQGSKASAVSTQSGSADYDMNSSNMLRRGYNASANPFVFGQMPQRQAAVAERPAVKTPGAAKTAAAKKVNAANAQDAKESMTFAKYKQQDPYFFAEESDPGWIKAVDYPFTMLRDLGAQVIMDRDLMALGQLLALGAGTSGLTKAFGRTAPAAMSPAVKQTLDMAKKRSMITNNARKAATEAAQKSPGTASAPRMRAIDPTKSATLSPAQRAAEAAKKSFGTVSAPRTRALPNQMRRQEGGPVVGDEMEVTPEQLEQLRAQGYQFEII